MSANERYDPLASLARWTEIPFPGEWSLRGACRGGDPKWFFVDRGRKPTKGLEICATCPVTEECLHYAKEHGLVGVWGGVYFSSTVAARRQGPPRHGTWNAYIKRGCRCAKCTAWNAARSRNHRQLVKDGLRRVDKRERPDEEGLCGTDSGYFNHRRAKGEPACDACKRAHTQAEVARNRAKGIMPRGYGVIPKTKGTESRAGYSRRNAVRGRLGETQPTDLAG